MPNGLFKWIVLCSVIQLHCSTGQSLYDRSPLPHNPIITETPLPKACLKWQKKLHARISYINLSKTGDRILVSTSNDRFSPRGRDGRLQVFNRKGSRVWSRWLKKPVRAQDLSADGNLYAINTWGTRLIILNKNGKPLWSREHLGKPIILQKMHRLLQLNNDDSQLKKAFFNYSLDGALLSTAIINRKNINEAVGMFVANDEQHVLVTTSGHEVILFSSEGLPIWRGSLDGKAIAAAFSIQPKFTLFILTSSENTQRLIALQAKEETPAMFEELWSTNLNNNFSEIQVTEKRIFLYGTSNNGQVLSVLDLKSGEALWNRSYSNPSAYASMMYAHEKNNFITVAIDKGLNAGDINIIGVDQNANLIFDIPVHAPNGIYAFAYSELSHALIVGAGDPRNGVLSLYSTQCR